MLNLMTSPTLVEVRFENILLEWMVLFFIDKGDKRPAAQVVKTTPRVTELVIV